MQCFVYVYLNVCLRFLWVSYIGICCLNWRNWLIDRLNNKTISNLLRPILSVSARYTFRLEFCHSLHTNLLPIVWRIMLLFYSVHQSITSICYTTISWDFSAGKFKTGKSILYGNLNIVSGRGVGVLSCSLTDNMLTAGFVRAMPCLTAVSPFNVGVTMGSTI